VSPLASGSSVNDCEEVEEPSSDRQWADQINVKLKETAVWDMNVLWLKVNVAIIFPR
jgi:hypothetical protein